MRLIDANALKSELIFDVATTMRMQEMHKKDMALRVLNRIDEAPTIEAEPVRHGRWGEAEIIGYNGYHAVYARPCMLCGSYTREYKPPYCSNCGAKMDAKEEAACD